MSHTVPKAKRLVLEIRKSLSANESPSRKLLDKSEKMISELVECVEYISLADRKGGQKDELKSAILEIRAHVWKVNEAISKIREDRGLLSIPAGPMMKSYRKVMKALDDLEKLLEHREC